MYTGIEVLLYLQDFRFSAPVIIDNFFHLISHPFLVGFFPVFLMAVLYWCYNKHAGTFLAFNIFTIGVCTSFLKLFLCVPRPWVICPEICPTNEAISGANGFSCPSGHTTSATALFGSLAVIFRKFTYVPVLCIFVIALIGFSRMYLGVHTPIDVFFGLVLAGSLLWFNWHLLKFIDRNPQMDWFVAFVSVGIIILFIASVLLRRYFGAYFDVDGVDIDVLIYAFTEFFHSIGWFVGFLFGWLLERKKIRFTIPLKITSRILQGFCGLLLLLILQICLSEYLLPLLGIGIGKFLSNMFLGLFISAGYPWLFSFIRKKRVNR
ncbi:MAG: phosphatase PAP2 family protein [Methanocalculaceae archaeon]|jgi:membrane-associated phospholipid phosphatase|nr:phosphatase PAP2 family protein [Methanocalculaceae archaeon]